MKEISQNDKKYESKDRKIKLELCSFCFMAGGNRIGDKGCKELAKFNFRNVVKLNLCTSFSMKV